MFAVKTLRKQRKRGYNSIGLQNQTVFSEWIAARKVMNSSVNILYIDHYAGSNLHGMEFRPFLMAKRWVQAGHNVTIAASSFSHLRGQNPDLMGKKTLDETIDGVRFFWIYGNHYSGNGLDRVRNILSFVRGLTHYQDKLVKRNKPDVVIASSTYPMDIYPAAKIAKKYNARLVYEVHDLWPLSPMEVGGMSRLHPFIQVMQRAENYAYANSDQVVSVLPNAKSYMMEHGLTEDRFTYIPNGVEKDAWKLPENPEDARYYDLLHQFREEGWFLVGYAGAHSPSSALDSFVEAGKDLKGQKIKLVMVGQGPEKSRLQQKINDLDLRDTVESLEAVRRSQIPGLLNQFDALYIGIQKQPVFRYGISPNKLFDYMMAGKPIIYGIEYENNAVKKSGCGISIPSEDSSAIARAAIAIASVSEGQRRQMGKKGRAYVLENHEYDGLAKRFLEVLEKPSSKKVPGGKHAAKKK